MSVRYEQAEGTDLFEKSSEQHLKELAMAQATENANDPGHIAKVDEAIRRVRSGAAQPLSEADLRRKLRIDDV